MADKAESDVQIDNDATRVTLWRFAPGASTGFHRHDYDYVIVPLAPGPLRQVYADGSTSVAELETGTCYFREAGVEHDVVYDGEAPFAFVELEFKSRQG
jgi:quercetin dioxygenase-like cupin family protein